MASLSDQLRAAVRNADVSRYRIYQDTKVDQAVLSKFVQGKAWLSEESVNRLADYLGIELVIKPKKTRKRKADEIMASVFKRGGKGNRHGDWYVAWWVTENGRRRRKTKSTGTTDKATAERIANKYEADEALRREGVIDPALDSISRESRRTLESHLADYDSKLRAGGRSEQYIGQTKRYIREIAASASFVTAGDIEPDGVNLHANSLKDNGKSARTIQASLTAIKGFAKWLASNHKLPRDPLVSIRKPNPKTDPRLERRMLLPDEWHRLAPSTVNGPDRYGMASGDRLLLYRTAIETGLRSNELRSLTRMSLVVDTKQPYVRARAATTKNRKEAQQFIAIDLAEQLRTHVKAKAPAAPVFELPDPTDMAAMLREDLTAARRAWLRECLGDLDAYIAREQSDFLAVMNHDGQILDFHSLRHTCGAWLAMAGEQPKVVQIVMRHSSITLTLDTYGHLWPGQEAEAVRRLGDIMGRGVERLAATGTYDSVPEARSAGRSSQDANRCVTGATRCDEDAEPATLLLEENALNSATRCDVVPSGTMLCYPLAPLAQLAEQLTLNQ